MDFVLLIGVFVVLSCGILPLGFALLLFAFERREPAAPDSSRGGRRWSPMSWNRGRDPAGAETRNEPPARRAAEPL